MPYKDPEQRKAYSKAYRRTYTAQQRADLIRRKKESIARAQDFITRVLSEQPCVDCGEDDLVVLDFDHLPEFKKTAGISKMVRNGVGLKKLMDEVAKCEVVCANCHRRRTARRAGWSRYGALGER